MPTHHQGPPSEVRALDAFIKLMRATDSIAADLARQLDALGLTLGQLAILEALLHLGAMSQQQLAGKIMRSGSHVTTVLDHLEQAGLVSRTRRADDRRVVDVALTPKGRRRIAQVFPKHARRIAERFGALPPAEQQELGRLCKKLGTGGRHRPASVDIREE